MRRGIAGGVGIGGSGKGGREDRRGIRQHLLQELQVPLPFVGGIAEVRSLTILHTNDLHARISPLENGNGGFAYLATVLKRERAGCVDCIFLNAGDMVQGSPVSTIFHGLPVYEIANLLGLDAATLGNHDFDYAWPQARKFLQTAKYPIVDANIVNARGERVPKASS